MDFKYITFAYLAAGLATCGLALLRKWLTQDNEPEIGTNRLGAPSIREKILDRLFLVLVFAIATVGWPAFVYMFWLDRRLGQEETKKETKAFSIEPSDLIRMMTVEQIETLERIDDPLGAAPKVPFGHLNAGWIKFLQQFAPGDTIWSFSTTWISEFEQHIQEDGYALVRDGRAVAHYLTRSKYRQSPATASRKISFQE